MYWHETRKRGPSIIRNDRSVPSNCTLNGAKSFLNFGRSYVRNEYVNIFLVELFNMKWYDILR